MENCIAAANMAVIHFTRSSREYFELYHPAASAPREEKFSKEVREKISERFGGDIFCANKMQFQNPHEFEFEILKFTTEQGFLPKAYHSNSTRLHAKSLIMQVDIFGRFLGDLAKEDGRDSLANIVNSFGDALPDLRGVRNSIAHAEDRAHGKARGREISPKPFETERMHFGSAYVDMLDGNKYHCTMENGHVGTLEISMDTVQIMIDAICKVYDEYEWEYGKTLPDVLR